jgi:hypothetical protein
MPTYVNPNKEWQENVQDPSTISSATMAPTPSINYQTPKQTPIYPVAGLNSDPFAATEPEQKADDLTTSLQSLNDQLVGQSQVRAEEEAKQGIPQLTQTQNDLSSKLKGLQSEALAIPLQLQNDATGKGITTGGLQPIQTAALRNNAIQSLSVSSLLEASRGNLTTALSFVDRAVAQKFDPIKEEIAAKTANLDLILKSPAYSLADKKRAQQQKDQQEARASEIAVQEENQKTIQGLALQALQNGAPSVITDKIMQSKDIAAAFAAAQGYAGKETVQSIQEYNFAVRNGYKGSYSQYQDEDANRKIAIARAGVSGQFGMSVGQSNLFNNIVNKYNSSPLIQASDRTTVLKNSIAEARKTPNNGPTQLNLVYAYIQALDTYQSAVREGELGLVNSIDSKTGSIQNYIQKIQNGQIVRSEVALDIANSAEKIVDTIKQAAEQKAKSYESQATTLGFGDAWKSYQGGFNASYEAPIQQNTTKSGIPFDVKGALNSGYTQAQIDEYLSTH